MWVPIMRTAQLVPGVVAKPVYRYVDGSAGLSDRLAVAARTAHHPAAREVFQLTLEANEALRKPRK